MKRVFSILLSVVCILTVMPFGGASAMPSDFGSGTRSDGFTYYYEYRGGTAYYWFTGYVGTKSDIVISAESGKISYISKNAFSGNTTIEHVTITGPGHFDEIRANAFSNCPNLTSVTISGLVDMIHENAFAGCKALTTVTISDNVQSIGDSAFEACTALERVGITDLAAWCRISFENETSNPLYYAKNLYVNGELLTELVIPDSVTSIGSYAFYNTAITSVTIPNSVWSIGADAFGGCAALTDVYYEGSASAWEMLAATDPVPSSVTVHILGEENYDNNVLAMLDYTTYADGTACINGYYGTESYLLIPSEINGYTVTAIGEKAFQLNSNLTHVIIPDSVTSIGDQAFALCDNIISIEIGNSVTSIGNNAFDFCESLQSLTIPKSVTSIGEYAIWNCPNLTDIYYEGSREEWNQNVQKHLYLSIQPDVTIHYDWAELSQGDLTGDGIVDMFDAMALYTAVSGNGTLTEAQELAADINADGTIDMFDALALYIQVSGQ